MKNRKKTLITGASGFVGRHLVRHLAEEGHTPVALGPGVDLLDREALERRVVEVGPDACVHLAARAFVPDSWRDPGRTFEVNVLGTLRLIEALSERAPAARLLLVSSSEVYGPAPTDEPKDESAALDPRTPYGVSKVAMESIARTVGTREGLDWIIVRPQNQIGPGQSDRYVVPAFARQIAERRRRLVAGPMRVGNLESRRHFLDVRDVVEAYGSLLERGVPGATYNVAAQSSVGIGELLETLSRLAGVAVETETDPALFRPTDASPDLSSAKLTSATGWSEKRSLEDTLRDLLEEFDRE